MDFALGSERQYLDNILRLVNSASSFLDKMRASEILYLSSGSKSRIDKMISLVGQSELGSVSKLKPDIENLNSELRKLAKKFQIIRNSYKGDSALVDFLGEFHNNQQDCYKKLKIFIDSSLSQIDTVITAYSNIEKKKTSIKNWILTILSHQSSQKAMIKARAANQVVKALETLIEDIRDICQNTRVELLDIRAEVSKHTKPPI